MMDRNGSHVTTGVFHLRKCLLQVHFLLLQFFLVLPQHQFKTFLSPSVGCLRFLQLDQPLFFQIFQIFQSPAHIGHCDLGERNGGHPKVSFLGGRQEDGSFVQMFLQFGVVSQT